MSLATSPLAVETASGGESARQGSVARRGPLEHRWTYEQFVNLWELGLLGKRSVELIDGRIFRMAPQKDLHFGVVELTRQVLAQAFGAGFWVRPQGPLRIGRYSGPEPDIAVVAGSARDYIGKGHPATALLVVEVSDTTLRLDRGLKAAIYARAGIADYWIVNLIDRVLEVHRDPVPHPSARLGHRYASIKSLQATDSITPLASPQSSIAVADLLP